MKCVSYCVKTTACRACMTLRVVAGSGSPGLRERKNTCHVNFCQRRGNFCCSYKFGWWNDIDKKLQFLCILSSL